MKSASGSPEEHTPTVRQRPSFVILRNPSNKALSLRRANLQAVQLSQLESGIQLQSLNLEGNDVDGETLSILLNKLSQVKRVSIDPWKLRELQVEGNGSIQLQYHVQSTSKSQWIVKHKRFPANHQYKGVALFPTTIP